MNAQTQPLDDALRRIVFVVALANLAYGVIVFAVAARIESVSLFAGSVVFFEDASVKLLIFLALAWTAARRAKGGMALAAILLVPGLGTLWTLVAKLQTPTAPDALQLGLVGLGALAVNLVCAALLARYRGHAGRPFETAIYFQTSWSRPAHSPSSMMLTDFLAELHQARNAFAARGD